MFTKIHCIVLSGVLILLAGSAIGQSELPAIKGGWWQIAEKEPDVSPWNNPGVHNACDFSIWQDDYGTWHLVACIRETTFPGATRLFHHWTSPSLTTTMWTPATHINTFETTNGTVTVTNGIFAVSNPAIGQYDGVMQAPHCIKNNGKYYFFYNGAYVNAEGARQGNAAYCKISDDGATFTDTTNSVGSYKFFDMGRDISLMQTTNGTWNAYFENLGLMSARTAPDPLGPWSTNLSLLGTSGNPESPFVVRRGDNYYLWEQMTVYHSTNPLLFTNAAVTTLDAYQYAPEVFEYNGQYYMGSYDNGIWLTRLDWMPTAASQADITNMTVATLSYGSELIPRFNSYSTDYLIIERNAKSSLTFSVTPRDANASISMKVATATQQTSLNLTSNAGVVSGTAPLVVGENIVQIRVVSGTDEQAYSVHVVRKDSSNLETAVAPLLPESGLFLPGSTVILDSLSSLAAIHYTLDGSAPTAISPLYTGPITLASNATLRAIALLDGQNGSWISEQEMAAVYPAVLSASGPTAPAPTLQWDSQSGCQYKLETSTNLTGGTWSEAAVLDGTGSPIEYPVPPITGAVFYRVKTTF